ncbi:MAG TPA: SDR family NAD(P)-dependent oxidoreductase [Thermoanaerobaculia bacterium]|nr:SDR family NAD(P)-dependent oxidoreductase [Thermoanaerobaculia bacterium]
MAAPSSVIVVGVGARDGLGAALCRRFAAGGLHVWAAGRTGHRLAAICEEIEGDGGAATPVVTDTTREDDVLALFDRVESDGPPLEVVLYNAGNNQPGVFTEMEAEHFERSWRVGCFGGFLVGREAARRLGSAGRGTVIFTGATGSLRGGPRFIAFASAKAGLRMIAQGMARELGPKGVHVAHVVIDGGIAGERLLEHFPQLAEAKGEGGLLELDAIAQTYWQLHAQDRSAWTHELDLRPFKEEW